MSAIDPDAAEPELDARLAELHDVLRERGAVEPFVRLAIATLANTERMRRARTAADYIRCAEREGALLVDLTLVVLGDRAGTPLRRFLYAIAGPANLWDKLVDARADWRAGELAVPPGLGLHARILVRLVAGLPAAVRAHPRRRALVRWAAGWLVGAGAGRSAGRRVLARARAFVIRQDDVQAARRVR